MKTYAIDYSDDVQTGTHVVRARTPAGAMRALTKNWDSDGPDPWTFVITMRSVDTPRPDLLPFLRRLLSLEPLRQRHREERGL